MSSDEAFESIAYLFKTPPELSESGEETTDDIWMPEWLDRSLLDFSLESLKAVDAYLEKIYQNLQEFPDARQFSTILRSGSYVGEVTKRISRTEHRWFKYNEALKKNKSLKSLLGEEPTVGMAGVLIDKNGAFAFPINKVVKYLQNGSEDSVYFFAKVVTSEDVLVRGETATKRGLLSRFFGKNS